MDPHAAIRASLDQVVSFNPKGSSNIKAIGFDDNKHQTATGRMTVEFNGGALWHYDGVTREVYGRVRSSDSVGAAFNALVKSQVKPGTVTATKVADVFFKG